MDIKYSELNVYGYDIAPRLEGLRLKDNPSPLLARLLTFTRDSILKQRESKVMSK